MEEGNEDFVGSLLRDSPETIFTLISTNLDNSQAPLDVMPISSRMGPPADVPLPSNPKASNPEHSEDKSLKEQLEKVKAKTVPRLITSYKLRQIHSHYDIPNEVKTRIPLEGESVDTPSTKVPPPTEGTPTFTSRDTTLFLEFFNYGLRLPILVLKTRS
ncbi:hypothetical protein LIER_06186 [Lithospermum erythrorhizon]|uniref:Uncharacterized protein n=1 Tax=Lithospermum erythrorhizon TaxID=34254 RepID=A0AAV3P3L9_LITER